MRIDLLRIPKDRCVAVKIPDKVCASEFLAEMKRLYPDKVRGWYTPEFDPDEALDGGVCYLPHFESKWSMTCWSVNRARKRGDLVLEWEDILEPELELVTLTGDPDFTLLFGGGI